MGSRTTIGLAAAAAAALCVCVILSASPAAAQSGRPGDVALNKLYVSFSKFPDPFHWYSFFPLPRTVPDATADGWTMAKQASLPTQGADGVDKLTLWCRDNDFRVCLLFDQLGSVAGMAISVSVADIQKAPAPYPMDSTWRRQVIMGTEVYSAQVLFVPPKVIAAGGRTLTESTNTAEALFQDDLTSFKELPFRMDKAREFSYTRQGCMKGMGRHFFWNVTKDLTCEQHRPYFLLFDEPHGQILGYGITAFGSSSSGSRKYFEWVPSFAVKRIVPQGPDCMTEWVEKYGIVSLHVYFRESPSDIQCVADPPQH